MTTEKPSLVRVMPDSIESLDLIAEDWKKATGHKWSKTAIVAALLHREAKKIKAKSGAEGGTNANPNQ